MEKPMSSTIKELEQRAEIRTVWVGEQDRIASFHAVDTYSPRTFICRDTYIQYLQILQERGFRFQ